MAKDALTIRVNIDNLDETLRALNALPKEASDELRDKAQELSKELATKAQASGHREGHQAALVATTVKARRDRVPIIIAGGAKKLGVNKKPAYKLLFGSEFGASRLKQYKPHAGSGSYWFYKVIDDEKELIIKRWQEAADATIEKFSQ